MGSARTMGFDMPIHARILADGSPESGGASGSREAPVQDDPMRLDHVSYACSPGMLADVVQRLGSDLGAGFVDGGKHPSFGTRNFVLPLQGGSYVEVVAALDHPAAEKAPFGRAVAGRADDGGGWLGWVVAVDDIEPIETRLGRASVAGRRIRPDGYELKWRQVGVLSLLEDPQLPFFVAWDVPADEHPSHGASAVAIERIEFAGDPEVISSWLGQPSSHPLDDIEVEWVDADSTGIVAVSFRTPRGTVRID